MSESEFSVHTGSRARALRGNLLLRPVELGSVDPHAVQNDRELARDNEDMRLMSVLPPRADLPHVIF